MIFGSIQKHAKFLLLGSLIILILLWVHFGRLPGQYLHVYFLDVGQGDAILITTPGQQQILIDGGPGVTVLEELGEVIPFFNQTFDLVVLTHPHADHVDGLVEIVKRYEVRKLLITGVSNYNAHYQELLRLAREKEIPVEIAQADRDFYFPGGLFLDVLYPFENLVGQEMENVNNSSIVMRALYGEHEIMLTGDAEHEVERELLESDLALQAEVFKAGHHGSRTANSFDFVKAAGSEYGVIQCGKDNKFEHPHVEALDTFEELGVLVERNDLDGRVEFVLSETEVVGGG